MSSGRRYVGQSLHAFKHFLRLGEVLEGKAQLLQVLAADDDVKTGHGGANIVDNAQSRRHHGVKRRRIAVVDGSRVVVHRQVVLIGHG